MNNIMAHRGWSSRAPENTLAAIRLVLENNSIDYIEIDVQLTKDGVPVLIHDFHVERTTNGIGNVEDFSFEQIRKLDAGSWFSTEYKNEKIPTLKEALQLCKGRKKLNIELKIAGRRSPGIERKVVDLVREFGMEKDVIISSFDHVRMKLVSELAPEIATGLIIEGNLTLLKDQLAYTRATVISIAYSFLTKEFVKNHIPSHKIVTWTPNTREQIETIKQLDPNIIICTNYPEKVYE